MKIRQKILIFPIILTLTFGFAYLALNYFNNQNKKLLLQTSAVYLPCIEKSIRIHHNLFEIQKSLQDAVAFAEIDKLKYTDSLAVDFKNLCKSQNTAPANNYIDSIYHFFNTYYSNARNLSEMMIKQDISEQMSNNISDMLAQYNALRKMIENLEYKSKLQAEIHFINVEKNHRKSAYSNLIIILVGLMTSIFTAYFVSSAISKPLVQLNHNLEESSQELAVLVEELSQKNSLLTEQKAEIETTLEQVKATQSQLVEYEKLASIGMLSLGIAHEINNPLNFIEGGKTAVENYVEDNLPNHRKYLAPFIEIIETGIYRASAIVKSLNNFSRKSENYNENCDIHLIINNCLQILHNKLKNKTEVIKEYSVKPLIVKGNESKLHQVFLNIIQNAEQSIETTGKISIETKVEKEQIFIQITDTGCGIAPEIIDKITEPFFTTKDPGKGTGLGLSITSNIIKEHRGKLEISSILGKGTQVNILFPDSDSVHY
jgi:signal transduction histidine kinase